MGLGRDACLVAPTALLLLISGAPTEVSAAELNPSATHASLPELILQEQFTFTGEVRDVVLVGDEVWAATGGGLAIHRRSDGAHLRTLTSGDGLPGNSLRSLAVLDAHQVLVGGDFGAAIVGVENGRPIVRRLGNDGMRFNPVYAVAADGRDVLLLRHQTGLERWQRVGRGWKRASVEGGAGMWRAVGFSSGSVLGGLDGRLVFSASSSRSATTFRFGAPILAMRPQSDFMVVATGEKLLQARADGVSTLVSALTNISPAATALSAAHTDGTVLVGTAQGALLDLRNGVLTPVADQLPGRVTAMAVDGDRVWLGLGRAGLHLWTKATLRGLRPANEICDNHIIAIVPFGKRTVVGTFDQGACYRDGHGWHTLDGLPSSMVHGVGSDGRDLFVATSNGLSRYDSSLRLRSFGRGDPSVLRWISQSAVTAIGQVDRSALALTSPYGLVLVRREGVRLSARFLSHRAGVPAKLVAVAGADGEVWMASETQGVKSLAGENHPVRHLQDPEDLPENWVTAIAPVTRDDLWVGTCQRGVAHIQGGAHQFFDRGKFLPDSMVVALAADARGAFVGTLGGLAFVHSDGVDARNFGWESGIPDPRSSALFLAGSQLWLGTEAGVARYELGPRR